MEEEKKSIIPIIITIIIVVGVILWYPWITKTKDGKTTCSNLLGFTFKCR